MIFHYRTPALRLHAPPLHINDPARLRRTVIALLGVFPALVLPLHAMAQSFDKVNQTVENVVTILITISVGVVTAAIMWAGYKMIFGGARLADVANVLFGGTLVGGAGAFAAYIIS